MSPCGAHPQTHYYLLQYTIRYQNVKKLPRGIEVTYFCSFYATLPNIKNDGRVTLTGRSLVRLDINETDDTESGKNDINQ